MIQSLSYSLSGISKGEIHCLALQADMQCKLLSLLFIQSQSLLLINQISKQKYIMYEESPFLSASEEHKQLPPYLDQYWTLAPHQLPLAEEIEYQDRREEVKNHIQLEDEPTKTTRKGRRVSEQNKNININRGHWSFEQNKKYHWFLQIHFKHFINRHMRRTDKIFKTMEIFIGTRQAEQCRSHHQKMEKKYLDFATIISNLRDIHYSTQDTQAVQDQLLANGIEIIDRLASMEQLKIYREVENETEPQLSKKMSVVRSPKQNKKDDSNVEQVYDIKGELERVEQHKQDNIQMVKINMFQELRNDLGEFRMYDYQKEESGIFQSFFQSAQ